MLQDTWVVPDPIEWEWPTQQPPNTAAQLLFMLILFTVVILCIICILRLKRKNPPPTLVVKEPAPLVLIVCPYCGAKNEQGILKCRACGAEM